MIEWVIFVVVIILYVYYIYRRNGGESVVKWKFLQLNKENEDTSKTDTVKEVDVFYFWIGALNRLIYYTNMRYYIFVDKLPLLKDAEEEILYCLMDKRVIYTASRKKPFFKTYIVTGGLYKEVDIAKYN